MKLQTRRFLVGLSSDELQFIAEYLGACILASAGNCPASNPELSAGVLRFQPPPTPRLAADRELKLILLREFLSCAGVQEMPLPAPHAVN